MPALSFESFEQACAYIAGELHITQAAGREQDVKELVNEYLSTKRAGRWLLVVDNADDMEILFGTGRQTVLSTTLPRATRL